MTKCSSWSHLCLLADCSFLPPSTQDSDWRTLCLVPPCLKGHSPFQMFFSTVVQRKYCARGNVEAEGEKGEAASRVRGIPREMDKMQGAVKTSLFAKSSSIASHKKRGVSFSGTSLSRGLVCIIKVRLRKQLIITVPQVSTFISLQLLTFNPFSHSHISISYEFYSPGPGAQ